MFVFVLNEKGVPSYGAVILLLRNPYHALVAERNRKNSNTSNTKTSHTRTVGPEYFGMCLIIIDFSDNMSLLL